ncbi:hypothetical protein KO116_00814 [Halomonas sp. KO116]|nr:hypothetical protein KO116_00814 [Halomonas sp. KO116]
MLTHPFANHEPFVTDCLIVALDRLTHADNE